MSNKLQGLYLYLRDKTPLRRLNEWWILKRYDITKGLADTQPAALVMTDYMDTLVRRSLSIVDVLKAWSKEMETRFGIEAGLVQNCRLAIAGGPLHCTVLPDVVYGMVADHCIEQGALAADRRSEFCEVAHTVEMDLELETQSVIASTRDYLLAARENGSRIACVTDLRLSGDDVRRFLTALDLLDMFDYVISSADVGKTKKEGGLYDEALRVIGADPTDCLMMGDNLHSDCVNANKHGIRACWIA
jgi:phosphoglycolate phosphatase-like HAD superfamily hydrolase